MLSILAGCGTFDDSDTKSLERMQNRLTAVRTLQKTLESKKVKHEWANAFKYNERLEHSKRILDICFEKIKTQRKVLDDNPWFADDKKQEFLSDIEYLDLNIRMCQSTLDHVNKDFTLLENIEKDKSKYLNEYKSWHNTVQGTYTLMNQKMTKLFVDFKPQEEFFKKQYMEPVIKLKTSFEDRYSKLDSTNVVSIFEFKSAEDIYIEVQQKFSAFNAAFNAVYCDEIKILKDMKLVKHPYLIQCKYEWDEWSDFDTTKKTKEVKVPIKEDELDSWTKKLDANPDGVIVDSGYEHEVVAEDVDWEEQYYHSYIIINNGKKRETGWVEVDDEVWEENIDNLGMQIYHKPLGERLEQANEQAIPPGMEYVNNEKYGRWENNSNGIPIWVWFMMYHNMYGSNSYGRYQPIYRNDYTSWRNNSNRNYFYGSNSTTARKWGTDSTFTKKSMTGSTFAMRGGYKSASVTSRNASRALRGGGPGGSGK